MKKLLRLDSIDAGGRAPQEVHDILASRCIVTPHPDLPAPQAEEFATQVSLSMSQCGVEALPALPPRFFQKKTSGIPPKKEKTGFVMKNLPSNSTCNKKKPDLTKNA